MELSAFLQLNREEIIGLASGSLSRIPVEYRQKDGRTANRDRVEELFNLTLLSIETRNYLPLIDFSEKLAKERFDEYYDLHDIQVMYNVLEEELWKKILDEFNPEEFQDSLSLISTILGFGKEMIATTFSDLSANKAYRNPFEFGQVTLAF